MSDEVVVPSAEVAQTPRYKVSRKGMGGRKPKYTQAQLDEVLGLVNAGQSLLAVTKEKGYPYVSVRAALKRMKMWPVVIPSTPPSV